MKIYSVMRNLEWLPRISFIGAFDTMEKANDAVMNDIKDIHARNFSDCNYEVKIKERDNHDIISVRDGYSYHYWIYKTELNCVIEPCGD